MEKEELINIAKKASENAWCPYSNFAVGTALLTKDDKIYTGCNVENHGIQSICGERVAFSKAISEGKRNFKAIAIVGKQKDEEKFKLVLPCGYCRQFMTEFCDENFKIYVCAEKTQEIEEYLLKDLLPYSFEFARD